jgi:uncharacterized protein
MLDRAVGLVYTPGLEPLLRTPGLVDVVEIEPELFWYERDGEVACHRAAWSRVVALPLPKLMHGVGTAVGGTRPPAHGALWLRCLEQLGAEWASHHLAFNWFGDPARFAGFFLPPRQTDDGVRAAAASIRAVSDALPCAFAVETGVHYLRPRPDELPDGEFVARVCRAADCAVLLDLHNLWTNQRNGRQSIDAYLAALPLDRVIEVHVAGGFALDGYWLDAHSGAPPDPLLDVLDEVLPHLPAVRAVCFEVLAPYVPALGLDAAAAVLERIRRAWSRLRGRISTTMAAPAPPIAGPSPRIWEDTLGALAIGDAPDSPLARELAADPGIALLAKLVAQGRAGMVTAALPVTIRLLILALGPDASFALLERFWRAEPPQPFASAEAEALAAWLAAQDLGVPHLADALAFDLASGRAESTGAPVEVELTIDPRALCEALGRGELPGGEPARVFATVTPGDASDP